MQAIIEMKLAEYVVWILCKHC